jgi:lysine-N-methylase
MAAPPPLLLPTLQNWSCHNCGGCCRRHDIEITAEERARIEGQGWTPADGVPAGPLIERSGGWLTPAVSRLAHRPDGGCVFLDDRGLCRIHAKFGEAAKPLACRLYPFVFHPAGQRIVVGLRYSCPSVVADKGRALSERIAELKGLEREVVPEGAKRVDPPEINPGQRLSWPDTLRVIDGLDRVVADTAVPLRERLLRLEFLARMLDQARFEKIAGGRVDELLELLSNASGEEVRPVLSASEPPQAGSLVQFRLLCAQYARLETYREARAGWRYRWRLLRAAVRFARGTGNVPVLQEGFREVPFVDLDRSFGGPDAGMDEILTRFLRVKLQSLHFCGRAYYDIPLAEGLASLLLAVAATCWLGRWRAASEGRTAWTGDDLAFALAVVDHQHGFSPALGHKPARSRVRLLWRTNQLATLVAWGTE